MTLDEEASKITQEMIIVVVVPPFTAQC